MSGDWLFQNNVNLRKYYLNRKTTNISKVRVTSSTTLTVCAVASGKKESKQYL